MRKIVLIMMVICSASVVAGEIEEYHNKYRKKFVDTISKADRKLEVAKQERDGEVKKTIEAYIGVLEKVKDGYTKAAKLEEAIKVRDEIAEMKTLLKGGDASPTVKLPKQPEPSQPVDAEKSLGYELKFHPFNAKRYNGHYYTFYDEEATYVEAVEAAKQKGGYLAVVTTRKEADFIAEMAKLDAVSKIWLGGSMAQGKAITWVTGETGVPDKSEIPRNYRGPQSPWVTMCRDPGTMKLVFDGGIPKVRKGKRRRTPKAFYVIEWEK